MIGSHNRNSCFCIIKSSQKLKVMYLRKLYTFNGETNLYHQYAILIQDMTTQGVERKQNKILTSSLKNLIILLGIYITTKEN